MPRPHDRTRGDGRTGGEGGLAFIICALAVDWGTAQIRRFSRHLATVSVVSGVFVAALGVLLLFDVVGRLSRYLPQWAPPL